MKRFLRAWAKALGGGLAFVGLTALLCGVVFVLLSPALIFGPWGLVVTLVLTFLLVTLLIALEDV